MTSIDQFWAVIPAGGAGTRLWPLSRAGSPKFLHDLTGCGETLLQATVSRLQPLVGERLMVVTGAKHANAVAAQVPETTEIVAEPAPRDSMAAIGLAAALLEAKDPDAIMGSFAADHIVAEVAAFEAAVATAVEAARDGWLVTIGIQPTFPSAGFGYIHLGEEFAPGVRKVQTFVEKPSVEVAKGYLATGEYRWNASMFVVRPSVLLDLLAVGYPEFAATLRAIAADPDLLAERWASLPKIALDYAVAEPAADAGRVACVPGLFTWDDIGDFDSLASMLGSDEGGTAVLGDESLVRSVGSSGLVVTGGRVIAVIGLDDVIVVDTPDALLVTTRDRAQDVKGIVTALQGEGHHHLT